MVLMMVFYSCNSGTSSSEDKVTISGLVKLVDLDGNEAPADQVTVAVFEKDESDLAWDYRLEKPIIVTETNELGEFSYKADDSDNFIVYFLNNGYSIKSFNQKNLVETINLFEDIEISGTITSAIQLNGTSDLVITNDAIFIDGGTLSVSNNSLIRIAAGVNARFYSNINFAGPVSITSNDKIYSFNNDQVAEFMSFEIGSSATVLNNTISDVICSNTKNGFIIQTNNIQINDSYFINSSNGLYFLNSDGHILSNIFVENISNPSGAGIYLDMVNDAIITKCDLVNNINGIKVKEVYNLNVNNCKIENNNSGYLSYYSTGLITHNQFNENSYGLELLGNRTSGNLFIQYNAINDSDIAVYQHESGSWSQFYSMIINNNNFINVNTFIKYDSSGIYQNLDATNNYFEGLSSETEILARILDSSLLSELFIDVNVIPFKTSSISSAGIIQE